jgi:hypothetical protein
MADGGAPRGARILYITGSGRSGTNFLGQLLGQADRFCFVGEAMYGGPSLATRRCGCGVPLPDCEFWRGIRRDAGGGRLLDEQRFFGLGRLARWRHLPLTLAPDRNRRLAALYGRDWQGCATLYATIGAATGAEVIVDTSKSVPYARMLSLVPGLDVRVVHLVRDARAVAYSWRRLKPAPDRFDHAYMGQRHRGLATTFWMLSNASAELFLRRAPGRYLRLRYEDFVARPQESLDAILRMATERPVELPFVGLRTVELAVAHSVCGNPDRVRTGLVDIVDDDEWKTRMPGADHRFVTAAAWPLLARYGYLGRPWSARAWRGSPTADS